MPKAAELGLSTRLQFSISHKEITVCSCKKRSEKNRALHESLDKMPIHHERVITEAVVPKTRLPLNHANAYLVVDIAVREIGFGQAVCSSMSVHRLKQVVQ
jgi:hypothetical protein